MEAMPDDMAAAAKQRESKGEMHLEYNVPSVQSGGGGGGRNGRAIWIGRVKVGGYCTLRIMFKTSL